MIRAGVLNGVGTGMRLGLAAVWLVSGSTKAVDPDRTYVAVRAYDVLPRVGVGVVATVLPFFELALGILLVVGVGTRVVAGASAVLLARDVGFLGLAAWLVVRPATLLGLEDRPTRRT